MLAKTRLRKFLERTTGIRFYRLLPAGVDPFYDLQRNFRSHEMSVIFDVGANVGQSAEEFVKHYPSSQIYCFEPSLKTFVTLKSNLKQNSQVKFYHLALGGESKIIHLGHFEESLLNRVIQSSPTELQGKDVDYEEVPMDTLSNFCQANNIKHINFLKVDTEGFDLEVMKSGQAMLATRSIDFVFAEVGMNNTNTVHVPFEELKEFMQRYNYYLFGIYDQVRERRIKRRVLRRVNVLFVSPALIDGVKS